MKFKSVGVLGVLSAVMALGCSPEPEGLWPAKPADTTVKMDFFHKPLPDIALPNDVATRFDPSSPTGRRINASLVTPTRFESTTRQLIDGLDGWGVLQPLAIPFTGPLDVESIRSRHDDPDFATEDDAIYLINIDEASANYGELVHLDLGNGNFPAVHERPHIYGPHDVRGNSLSLLYEEANEDLNGNGVLDGGEDLNGNGTLDPGEDIDGDGQLDPPEDTDADGQLDVPNYLPGMNPGMDDLAGRADALMTFYEKATNTVIARPMMPLDDRTRYAVVVTRRVLDASGNPVGSPYGSVNHLSQTEDLGPLMRVLPAGITPDDIAFTYSYTTQTIRADWLAVRNGLYGIGPQAHLATDFPARVATIEQMRDEKAFPNSKKRHLLYGEQWQPALHEVSVGLLGQDEGVMLKTLLDGSLGTDYFTIGSYISPQLFPREDGMGNQLSLNEQVWPADLANKSAPAREETVYFSLAVPRKEVSVRKEGKQVPVIILGHGYTGNRFDVMQFSSYMTRQGFAVIGIDGPSHGISISKGDEALASAVFSGLGLGAAGRALLSDRSFDQDGDGAKDSGADFWTSYMFHTRDMVRQFALDYMQLVRTIKSFDGTRRWEFDTNGDGEPDLAGDFDGDGQVDIGADSELHVFGGSLGGIMSMILGAVEPSINSIAPISGGGGYGEMGARSTQGGVYQSFILRVMGPIFHGEPDTENGGMKLHTLVVSANDDVTLPIGNVQDVNPWDTFVVENLDNGERGCGYVQPDGTVRAGVEADIRASLQLLFYRGPQLVTGSEHCDIRDGVTPYATVDKFGETIGFEGEAILADTPLFSLMEGLGVRRAHQDARRLTAIGQLALDPADPAVLAPFLLKNPLVYADGQRTGAHSLIITTMGDTAVPVSGGIMVGRASGLVNYTENDARFGKPMNQVLVDTHTTEGVHTMKRYTNPDDEGVHLDVENFSQGTDMFGTDVPRLETPLRIGIGEDDGIGGVSAAIFPYNVPGGQHGFDLPGGMTDRARKQCAEACMDPDPATCGCDTLQTYDVGFFMMNMIAHYFATRGTVIGTDLCQSRNDCSYVTALPLARDASELD